jgi:hypothetical protein
VGNKNARFLIIHNLSAGGFRGFGTGDGERGIGDLAGRKKKALDVLFFQRGLHLMLDEET